jgi:membrane protease YdiL (CAAX protease family)
MDEKKCGQEFPVSYWQLAGTAPAGLKAPRGKTVLKAPRVLLFFVIAMAVFVFLGAPVQYWLGLGGVAITELYLLAASLFFVWVSGADFCTVFPLKKVRPAVLGGTLVLWAGVYLAAILCNLILLFLFPESFLGSGQSMDDLMGGMPWPVAFLIIAVMPAVCEEAMHRGVLQCGISGSVRKGWQLVLSMGLLFGVFHLSPVKFPGMVILGAAMSYLLLVTDNMAYSCFFHFFHNGLQVLMTLSVPAFLQVFPGAAADLSLYGLTPEMIRFALGFYVLFLGTGIPILLYTGSWLVKRAAAPVRPPFLPKGRKAAALCAIFIPTGLIALTGICLSASGFSGLIVNGMF